MLKNIFAFLICMFISGTCIADNGKKTVAAEVYSLSALDVQSERIYPVLQEELEEATHSRMSADDSARLAEIIRDAFSTQLGAADAITAALTKRLGKDEQETILKWLRSDPGRKMTRLERVAAQPGARELATAYRKKLRHKPLSLRRTLLMQKFKKKIVNKEALDRIIIVTEAVKKLAEKYASGGRYLSYEKSLKKMVKFIDAVRTQVNGRIFTHVLYTYRELSDDELKKYLDFISSDTGQKYIAAGLYGLGDAVEIAGKRMGAGIEAMAVANRKK